MKCIVGCKAFTGGEIYHHKDCPFYPESMSKMFDDAKQQLKEANKQTEEGYKTIEELIDGEARLTQKIEDMQCCGNCKHLFKDTCKDKMLTMEWTICEKWISDNLTKEERMA